MFPVVCVCALPNLSPTFCFHYFRKVLGEPPVERRNQFHQMPAGTQTAKHRRRHTFASACSLFALFRAVAWLTPRKAHTLRSRLSIAGTHDGSSTHSLRIEWAFEPFMVPGSARMPVLKSPYIPDRAQTKTPTICWGHFHGIPKQRLHLLPHE